MRSFKFLAAALVASAIALPAQAVVLNWSASLDQAQEIPAPIPVPGATGMGLGTIDTGTGDFTWTITYSGLSGPATGLHVHGPAAPGSSAGVQVNVGAISGLGTPAVGTTLLSDQQIDDVVNGLWYINIHTALNGSGELRGQINVAAVPLPAALPMGIFALGLLGLMRRHA